MKITLTPPQLDALNIQKRRLFLCDDKGKILDWLGHREKYRYQSLTPIYNTNNLFSVFNDKPVETSAAMSRHLPKERALLFDEMERFYTTLPVLNLATFPVQKGLRLGQIVTLDIVPNYFPDRTESFFLVDPEERLVGFNHNFYGLFEGKFTSPGALMGLPVKELLSPTPTGYQASRLADYGPETKEGFKERYARDFSLWNGPVDRDEYAYLTLPPSFNTLEEDLIVEYEAVLKKGQGPLLILSGKKAAGERPDEDGYLAGPLPDDSSWVLKRDGLIQEYAAAGPSKTKSITCRLSKIGKSLFLHLDGQLVLSFYDQAAGETPDAAVSLALRPGAQCLLRRVRVLARKSRPESGTLSRCMVTLQRNNSRFLMDRFYNNHLNTHFYRIKGFFLRNITDIQEHIESLESHYREERRKKNELEKRLSGRRSSEEQALVGQGAVMSSIRERARLIAASNATVLIQGQTGTGKEVLARFIHGHSPFRDGPFVKVDCSTLPRELMESELFGHEKGAFTGAIEGKTGFFERADMGTLFLDEVGNFTQDMQIKLLQFLQDFTVTRVGGSAPLKLDLRVIAASNAPLMELVRRGAFREDLYYRLFVGALQLPTLSERREDIPELCTFFLEEANQQFNRRIRRFTPDALKKILSHTWPGNVRELKNSILRAILLCGGDEITGELIQFESKASPLQGAQEWEETGGFHHLRKISDEALIAMVKKRNGNISRVAADLRLTRRALYYQFKRRGIYPRALRG